jgi:hypothetical protein
MKMARGPVVEALLILAVTVVLASLTLPSGALLGGGGDSSAGSGEALANVLPLDDAYIFVRFAGQLGRGRGLEWTDDLPSSGATSLAYLPLLLPGQWLGSDVAVWGRWSQWVGLLTLWSLGLAALGLLRTIGLSDPWPILGAMTVVVSGPVGWGALAGMESAWNAAAILFSCTCGMRFFSSKESREGGRSLVAFALSAAALPLFRPENTALAALACAAILILGTARNRWIWGAVALAPTAAMMLLNWGMTGEAKPVGAIVKAITEYPFLDLGSLWSIYALNLSTRLLPAYLGQLGAVLPVPVGWIVLGAALTVPLAVASPRLRNKSPLRLLVIPLIAWWGLFLLAPISSMLLWQQMRHHHAALTLAWVVAFALVALGFEWLAQRLSMPRSLRWTGAVIPALLLLFAPTWGEAYAKDQANILRRHGPAGEWLATQQDKQVLLVNDAGYLQVFHDGPAIDIMGLGTPALARPHRHGPGASVEALARQPTLPTIAAVNRDVFLLQDLLGQPLLPLPEVHTDTVLTEVRLELLEGTRLEGPGVDFGYLEDETKYEVRWTVVPGPLGASAVVLSQGTEIGQSIQGCRPVPERIEWRTPQGVTRSRILVFAPPDQGVELALRGFNETVLARTLIAAGGSKVVEFDTSDSRIVGLERTSGGLPCIESVAFEVAPTDD